MAISIYLLTGALLLLFSIFSSKLSDRYGVPALLFFLGIGMAFGSDGLNWIYFDNYQFAQYLGIIALAYILFSGGLDTNWEEVKPVAGRGLVLATLGVLISTIVLGLFASWLLDISLFEGLLIGAIVSSTDAAAVFSVLRSNAIGFKYRLKELLEFESATNDPMAIFLTIGVIQVISLPDFSWTSLLLLFVQQMGIGLIAGFLFGKLAVWVVNRINLENEGLYPVLILALVLLIYSATDMMQGSGFLAVYIAGLILGNATFIHKKSMISFFDGVGWLMQIIMFLTLGLLVFPSNLLSIAVDGLLIALVLMLVARPISVFMSLFSTTFRPRAKLMVSWTGLRGAVPIVMATFPLAAGLPNAELIFSIVFFIVVTSVLIQGPTLPLAARWLHVDSPVQKKTHYPIEFEPSVDTKGAMKEIIVTEDDPAVGKQVVELEFPEEALIVIINREGSFIVPRGTTTLQPQDKLLVLAKKEMMTGLRELIKGKTTPDPDITV